MRTEEQAVKEMTENSNGFFKYVISLKNHMETPEVEQFLGTLRLLLANRKKVVRSEDDGCPLNLQGWNRLMELLDDVEKPFLEFTKTAKQLHFYTSLVKQAITRKVDEQTVDDLAKALDSVGKLSEDELENEIGNNDKFQGLVNELRNEVKKEVENMSVEELEKQILSRFNKLEKDIDTEKLPDEIKEGLKKFIKRMKNQFLAEKERRKNGN